MILSFIDGRDSKLCIEDASKTLSVPCDLIERFVKRLLDNPNSVVSKGKDGVSAFPPYTIITQNDGTINKRYKAEWFNYETTDLRIKRHFTPSNITLMLNNVCKTNCIYCYQDKSRVVNCQIPLSRIKELIHEAHELRVNTFDVIGGEFFLYKHWKEVLAELRKYDFNPYLSTKMPLGEEDIQYLAKLNIHDIQVSVDSLIEDHLIKSIGVKEGYVRRIVNSLQMLDHYGIPVMVHSVLTKYNSSIEDMKSIYDVLIKMRHLMDWHVVKGDETLYPRTEYKNIEIQDKALLNIIDYLSNIAKDQKVKIVYPQGIFESRDFDVTQTEETLKEQFFNRSFCSGLFSSLYILPTGKVTICEQLYWKNPRFYVGDVMKNSLEEIWNSKESNELYYLKQSDIPEDSLCHSCKDFKKCREGRQVCYREIVKKHGSDKWYYPDVSCPYTKSNKNK